jgi:hypothetical protein
MAEGHVVELLHATVGPVDLDLHDLLALAEAEQQLLRVLGDEARAGLDGLRP